MAYCSRHDMTLVRAINNKEKALARRGELPVAAKLGLYLDRVER